jgi:hypothetical protein
MGLAYDSGWVTGSSGTINASVDCSSFTQLQVIFAASGTNGAGTTQLSWSAGAGTPVPWSKRTPAYPMTPAITGAFAPAAPGANAQSIYYIGTSMSGANHIGDWVPQNVQASIAPGAGNSWTRIVIIGK